MLHLICIISITDPFRMPIVSGSATSFLQIAINDTTENGSEIHLLYILLEYALKTQRKININFVVVVGIGDRSTCFSEKERQKFDELLFQMKQINR